MNKTCYNGLYRVNKKKKFNVPMGRFNNPTICDAENLRNISILFRELKPCLLAEDYKKVLIEKCKRK